MFSKSSLLLVLGVSLMLSGHEGESHPADENPSLTLPQTRRQFWTDRYGLFIHWGISSTLCDGDSVFRDRKLSPAEIRRVATFFNPQKFDAAQWVNVAKSAGMRYIAFTCRQSDGLAMWDSKVSDWNVVKQTPFGRDVVKDLASECQKQGIRLYLDYVPPEVDGIPGPQANKETTTTPSNKQAAAAASDLMNAQIIELMSKYGYIDGLRLEKAADANNEATQFLRTCTIVHALQPAALVGFARNMGAVPGQDFQFAEMGSNQTAAGYMNASNDHEAALSLEDPKVPLELSTTVNGSRGFRLGDLNFKSERVLLQDLIRAAGMDANLVFDVGAMPNGEIQPEITTRLNHIGTWLARHGESIYATRGGPVKPGPWGVTTQRGNKVYVHVLDSATTSVVLNLAAPVLSARYFSDDVEVAFTQAEGAATISLRPERPGEMDRLIVMRTKLP